jgi:hypothetical protein
MLKFLVSYEAPESIPIRRRPNEPIEGAAPDYCRFIA